MVGKYKKPIVIEFVGSPGTGKTTSSHCFSNVLKASGLKVCLIEDLERFLKNSNRVTRISIAIGACITKGPLLLLYVALFALNGIFSLDSFIHYASLTLREAALKWFCKYDNIDVVILDQWGIQALWSSTIFYNYPSNVVTKCLRYLYLKTNIVIYFDIPPAVASKRIELRPTSNSRFDLMDAQKREKELSKYDKLLFQLYLYSNCRNKYIFSTEPEPSENVKDFERIIKQYQDNIDSQSGRRRTNSSIYTSYFNYLSKHLF